MKNQLSLHPSLRVFQTLLILLIFLAGMLLSTENVYATGITVNTTEDVIDATDNKCSLREAVIAANSDLPSGDLQTYPNECPAGNGADDITVESGEYDLTIVGDDDLSAVGDLDITAPVNITWENPNSFSITASNSDRLFDIRPNAGDVSFSGHIVLYEGASTVNGGALRVNSNTNVTIDDIDIGGNSDHFFTAGNGGCIYVEDGGTLTLLYSQLEYCKAVSSGDPVGSAIYNSSGGTVHLKFSAIMGHPADSTGSPVHNAGTMTIENSVFRVNNMVNGSGGAIHNDTSGNLTMTNSTIGESSATGNGGAIYNDGVLNVYHSTISDDPSYTGLPVGGIYNASNGVLDLGHTIVNSTDGDCVNYGTVSGQYTLIRDNEASGNACGFTDGTDGNIIGQDPLVDRFTAHGMDLVKSNWYFELKADSPALNAGDPTFSGPPFTDQRPNHPRVTDGRIDIGAWETTLSVNAYDVTHYYDIDDGDCTKYNCSIREAFNAANKIPNFGGPDAILIQGSGSPPWPSHSFIYLLSPLPTLTEPVNIRMMSPPAYYPVSLDGSYITDPGVAGITIDTSDSSIQYLGITGFSGPGVLVEGGEGNHFTQNSIRDNGGLGIDLGNDGVNKNDFLDEDTGANSLQNAPVLQRAFNSGAPSQTLIQGFLTSLPDTEFNIEFYASDTCDASFYGEGETFLNYTTVTTNADGYAPFSVPLTAVAEAVAEGTSLTALAINTTTGDTSEFSRCMPVSANNDSWPNALEVLLTQVAPDRVEGQEVHFLTNPGQARWFRFPVAPDAKVIVELSGLASNYDLILYRDIAQTYESTTAPQNTDELTELNAEFASDMHTPDMYTPDMYTPDMYTPDMYTPDMYTPDMYTPDMYTPDMYTPDMYTPDMYAPDMYTPDMYTPDMYT
ncbi:MAG: CSLREA domain-containing protein, partial [Proteobacteria bacterium]|nr:CSLREA domain-containing protein [Pseudomonadota bacterium]